MTLEFLHGIETVEINDAQRPIRVLRSSVIGLVGTAPLADADRFPLDRPVLVTSRLQLAALGDAGTLAPQLKLIYAQAGAVVVVIRVAQGADEHETITHVSGGVDATTGQRTGIHALRDAQSSVGVIPSLLIAPGFTHQRSKDGVLTVPVIEGGSGHIDSPVVTASAPEAGRTARLTAVLGAGAQAGKVVAIQIDDPGEGYTTAPTISISEPPPDGTATTLGNATLGDARNRVVSELLTIAEGLSGIVIIDGPSTTDDAAIHVASDWDADRAYLVDPWVVTSSGLTVPASGAVAGLINRVDSELGFHQSPSNQILRGISGISRPIDHSYSDRSARSQLLNERNVTVIVHDAGYRLWGNRTLARDPLYAFLAVRRIADAIARSISAAHLYAVDRSITAGYVDSVLGNVNAFIRTLLSRGAIAGGRAWADPDYNTADQLQQGRIRIDYDFSPCPPAEHIQFASHVVSDYLVNVIPA
ncbi:MAG: phage tail protein [Aphanocapsa feldmannii 277cI]|uniref:Phage tail protein n=1 Tax=Aphanocapsa feldmannii 277cI TaxID=2507554 RepID=A0A524RVX4_9CHRO|nr:MAG: phage tail protein [Aphanocapsa feldmannii 277cI]